MTTPANYPNRLAQTSPRGAESSAVVGGKPVNWKKIIPPEKFDFGSGAQLVGILASLARGTVRDTRTNQPKPVVRYTVLEVDENLEIGRTVFFHGTIQLDSMLRPDHVGHYVTITCTGEDRAAGRNGNSMKLFDVMVSEDAAPGWANDGSRIGDNDLPDEAFMA